MAIGLTIRRAAAGVLACAGLVAGGTVQAADPASVESRETASELLSRMATFLAGLPGFEVELVGSYDAVQANGQKIEFNERRVVSVARPDKLRMEQIRSDGIRDLIVFDGESISIFNGDGGVFAQAPQPGSIDEAVVYFVRDLQMRLPLAALLTTRIPAELEQRVTEVDYVERTEILPVPAHHLAGRARGVDFQVWIADGDRPLPLRIVLTYVNEPGQPQFRAQFFDWKLQVPTAGLFRFEPPDGARQIAFAVQVPGIAAGAGGSVATPEAQR
jgi:hypothetical protein